MGKVYAVRNDVKTFLKFIFAEENMEHLPIEEGKEKEFFPLVSAKTLIPGIDEGNGRTRIRDAFYYSDETLSSCNPYSSFDRNWRAIGCSDERMLFRYLEERIEGDRQFEEYLRGVFGKTVLVDIGSGGHAYGIKIAELLGSKGYIAVEPHFFTGARNFKSSSFSVALVAEDAKTFLQRVPTNSISLLVSRIDGFIININDEISDEDASVSIRSEMTRVLSPSGGGLVYDSDFYPSGDNIETKKIGAFLSVKRKRKICS